MSRVIYKNGRPVAPEPAKPYVYQPYPKAMYKAGESRVKSVKNVDEEQAALDAGWGHDYVEPVAVPVAKPLNEYDHEMAYREREHASIIGKMRQDHADAMDLMTNELVLLKARYAALEKAHIALVGTKPERTKKNGR